MSVISKAWRRVRKDRGFIKRNVGFELYEEYYWKITKEVLTNTEIGHKRKNKEFNDEGMMKDNKELQAKWKQH